MPAPLPVTPEAISAAAILSAISAALAAFSGGFAFAGIRRDSGVLQAKIMAKGVNDEVALKRANNRITRYQVFFVVMWIGAVITGVLAALFTAHVL
jgi:hypothetical protein